MYCLAIFELLALFPWHMFCYICISKQKKKKKNGVKDKVKDDLFHDLDLIYILLFFIHNKCS